MNWRVPSTTKPTTRGCRKWELSIEIVDEWDCNCWQFFIFSRELVAVKRADAKLLFFKRREIDTTSELNVFTLCLWSEVFLLSSRISYLASIRAVFRGILIIELSDWRLSVEEASCKDIQSADKRLLRARCYGLVMQDSRSKFRSHSTLLEFKNSPMLRRIIHAARSFSPNKNIPRGLSMTEDKLMIEKHRMEVQSNVPMMEKLKRRCFLVDSTRFFNNKSFNKALWGDEKFLFHVWGDFM